MSAPIQNTVGVCKQITLIIAYCPSFRYQPVPVQVSDIFAITVCFSSLILPLRCSVSVSEMSTSFMSYIVQVVPVTLLPVNQDETTWLVDQLFQLSFYCADHCQPRQDLSLS